MVPSEWFLPAFTSSHKPFIMFSSPCPAEERNDQNRFGLVPFLPQMASDISKESINNCQDIQTVSGRQ